MKTLVLKENQVLRVDDADAHLLSVCKWYLNKNNGYAYGHPISYKKTSTFHRFLLGGKPGLEIDHINGDRLDNRRSNLRFSSRSENARNSKPHKGSLSKFKGVSILCGKWFAQIYLNKKNVYLGSFKSEKDAALAYNKKAKEEFGEFAYLNNI